MYTRWEYTDLTHYYSRIVMHMNPDGTENKALYGSGAMFPNSTSTCSRCPATVRRSSVSSPATTVWHVQAV